MNYPNCTNCNITTQVYSCIRDGEYLKAIQIFEEKLGSLPISRPALSILAYCCYHNKDYARAAEFYEELVALHPEAEDYQLYYVQSMFMVGSYHDAGRVAAAAWTKSTRHSQRLKMLQAHAEMKQGLYSACKMTLSQCSDVDPETMTLLGTLDFREGKFADALEKYKVAKQVIAESPMLSYYIALCNYRLGNYDTALDEVNGVIDGMKNEQYVSRDLDFLSRESANSFVIEALNLKAAIYYDARNLEAAKGVMKHLHEHVDDESIDSITIHNETIIFIDDNPTDGIQKLSYLVSSSPFSPDTLGNLIILHLSQGQYHLAVEMYESNKHLAKEHLPANIYAYLDVAIMSLSCPSEAFSKLGTLASQYMSGLKAAQKNLSYTTTETSRPATSARPFTSARPTTSLRTVTSTRLKTSSRPGTSARPPTSRKVSRLQEAASKEFDKLLDDFIPVMMLQAKYYWDKKDYVTAENLLRQSAEFCRESDAWQLNMGHILFQQNNRYEDCALYYEQLITKRTDAKELLKVPPIALANLCVAYIVTNRNETAEAIIKEIENEEKQQVALRDEKTYHTCIVNLVIGTLYCEKRNFEFGINRICKRIDPLEKKNLCSDTWYYTKRCFLACASKISKLMYVMTDEMFRDTMCFLEDIERHGKNIIAETRNGHSSSGFEEPTSVALEAKELKHIFIKLCA